MRRTPFYITNSNVEVKARILYVRVSLYRDRLRENKEAERAYGMSVKTGKMFLIKPRGSKYPALEGKKSAAMWSRACKTLVRARDELLCPQRKLPLKGGGSPERFQKQKKDSKKI